MDNELIIALIGVASTVVGSWTSWFFTRKKYNSEVDSTVINNMKEALQIYKDISDDNTRRLNEALERNKQLEGEVRDLRNQVFKLMNSICYDLSCSYRSKMPKTAKIAQKIRATQPAEDCTSKEPKKDENN